MTPEDFQSVRLLFHQAFGLRAADRAALLAQACAGRDDMRSEVEALLSAHGEAGRRFDPDDSALAQQLLTAAPCSPDLEPRQIGPYSILRRIGHGGMGVVYLARQKNPERDVALKVLRGGSAVEGLRHRFAREVRLLGQLQHPGIARIYEAGIAETPGGGLPYFAMEYIDGLPLTEFADHHELPTRARLELLASVCDAVQHAHGKGIIHRDLKPGNILISIEAAGHVGRHASQRMGSTDGEWADKPSSRVAIGLPSVTSQRRMSAEAAHFVACPKILDFGVARMIESEAQNTTLHTEAGMLIGTVAYISPEQLSGEPDAADTRSDVYSLGVMLFELITGRLPHDVRGRPLLEAARMIRDDEARPLRDAAGAGKRGIDRELQTLVSKALEKDPERRYGSAAELAADIRCYLNHEPLRAHPPSAAYLFLKFARRHRGAIAAVTGLVTLLIVAVVGTTIGMLNATAARDAERAQHLRADAEAQTTLAVMEFLTRDLLAAVSPENQGKDVPLRDVLDEAARRIEGRFPDRPLVEAGVRLTLGETYMALGAFELAEQHLQRAYEIRGGALGNADSGTRTAARALARAWCELDRTAKAEAMFNALLEQDRLAHGPVHDTVMADLEYLGRIYVRTSRDGDAERVFRDLLEARTRTLDADDPLLLQTQNQLASLLRATRRLSEAAPLIEKTLSAQLRTLGPEHTSTISTRRNLALLYQQSGRLKEAEAIYDELLPVMVAKFGAEHPKTLIVMGGLCVVYQQQGRLEEAERMRVAQIEAFQRQFGAEHAEVQIAQGYLAEIHTLQERWAEAESLYKSIIEVRERTLGPDHPVTRNTKFWLARTYSRQNRYADAERVLSPLIPLARKENDPDLEKYLAAHAIALTDLARYAEAESLLLEAAELPATPSTGPTTRYVTIRSLVDLYEAWPKPAEANAWRAKLPPNPSSAPATQN